VRLHFLPFWSQQSKQSNEFLLDRCSGTKYLSYMATECAKLGHDVALAVPRHGQCRTFAPFVGKLLEPTCPVPTDNRRRRLHWDVEFLERVGDADVVVTCHEFAAIPLRMLTRAKIVLEYGVRPSVAWGEMAPLFPVSWGCAHTVFALSETLAQEMRATGVPARVWKFGYDDVDAAPRGLRRDIDFLFPSRCSATGYTRHEEFLRATAEKGWRVVATDPTSYLRSRGEHTWAVPHDPLDREQYVECLHRAKVVVGLTDNGYGGFAFQEAVAAGALPVALRCPEYEEILGADWPYLCDLGSLASTLARARVEGWSAATLAQRSAVADNVSVCSYSSAWKRAKEDLCL